MEDNLFSEIDKILDEIIKEKEFEENIPLEYKEACSDWNPLSTHWDGQKWIQTPLWKAVKEDPLLFTPISELGPFKWAEPKFKDF